MKNKLILVGIHGRPSMKKVYDQMNVGKLVVRRKLQQLVYYRNYTENKVESLTRSNEAPTLNDSVVVRWGTREVLDTNGGTIVYNKSEAIKKATDKGLSRRLMAEHGVRVPKAVTPENFNEEDLPIISRPPVHAKGRNFIVLRSRGEFEAHYHQNIRHSWYYSAFVDKEHEYRVHCAHGKVLAMMEKTPSNDGKIAWNRALNDEPFEYVGYKEYDTPRIKDAIIEALKTCDALGLDFGGIDVMTKGDTAYVLEANTSPTLNSSDYVSTRWSEYFDWLFRSESRREHFSTRGFGKAKNFFFWHKQLKDN